MDNSELYDRLTQLLPSQLDSVVARANLGLQYLTPGAPPATRAKEIMELARQNEALRQAVVAALQKVKPASPNDPLQPWLEYCYRRHRHIPVIGYEDRRNMELGIDDVFVPLSLMPSAPNDEKGSFDDCHLTRPMPPSLGDKTIESVLRYVHGADYLGLAVIGDPGSGKTTLLKHLFCRVWRDGAESVGLPNNLIPVFIPVGRVAPFAGKAWGLAHALAELAKESDGDGYPDAESALQQMAANHTTPLGLLFLLDGLDEVASEESRKTFCEWLRIEADRWQGSFFVLTCRYAAWSREARLNNRFIATDVEWLPAPMMQRYVQKWFHAVVKVEEVSKTPDEQRQIADASAEDLIRALNEPERTQNYRMQQMARNPLLLSTLCLVYRNGHVLPKRRAELYYKSLGLLLEKWGAQKNRALPFEASRHVLQPLAWFMHERLREGTDGRVDGATSVIGELEAQKIIADTLQSAPDLKDYSPKSFLDRVCADSGVLVKPDFVALKFFHLGFQEYLAAGYVRSGGGERAKALVEMLGDSKWREVFLLAAALDGGMFVRLMDEVIAQRVLGLHYGLVEQSLEETAFLDPKPFVDLLRRAAVRPSWTRRAWTWMVASQPDPAWDPDTVACALRLFVRTPLSQIVEVAGQLTAHEHAVVREAAADVMRAVEKKGAAASVGAQREATVIRRESMPDRPQPTQRWVVPGLELELVWVPAGEFWMGSSNVKGEPFYDEEARELETPAHRVKLTQGYWIGVHPVTNAQYRRFVELGGGKPGEFANNARFNHPDQPVVGVDWSDTLAWCDWASDQVQLPGGWQFRLPTEAQWEYAARGENGRKYPWGKDQPSAELAVFGLDWGKDGPAKVGGRVLGRSPWGAEDMAGNVWEWCIDEWQKRYDVTPLATRVDPCHHGDTRVTEAPRAVRGGSWGSDPRGLRCANRNGSDPRDRDRDLGFRVVLCVSVQHA